ncbi:MAG: hypothetical protein IJQ14_00325 [Bacteroidales bacterium]|nr:hypothetical protein [Bacteroidales bacterium]
MLFVVLFVKIGSAVIGHHWHFDYPRTHRNYSSRRRLPRPPARACFPSSWPSSLLLSQPCLLFGRQPQHSSYELVPADVQQALLKAYEEAANEEE